MTAKWSQQSPSKLALAAAGAIGADRLGVEHPGGDVQRMDVLLGDDVAGEQAIHAPGAQADLGVLRVLAQELVHAAPRRAALVIGLDGDDLARSRRRARP